MSRNLRQIVRDHIEEWTLREYLGDRFNVASSEEKTGLLSTLRRRGEIDREVENVLNTFANEIQRDSAGAKKKKIRTLIIAGLNLIITIGMAYAVNEKAWVFVSILGVINLVVIALPIIFDE